MTIVEAILRVSAYTQLTLSMALCILGWTAHMAWFIPALICGLFGIATLLHAQAEYDRMHVTEEVE